MATYRGRLGITSAYELWKSNPTKFEPQRNNNFEIVIFMDKTDNKLKNVASSGLGNTYGGTAVEGLGTNNENTITDVDSKNLSLAVANFTAPSVSVSPIKISYGNNSAKFASVPEFSDSSITLNDYIGIDVERILNKWFKKVYNPSNGKIGFASNYKKNGILYEYSPNYEIVRSWKIYGMWLSNFNLGEFSQDGGSLRQLSGTIVYDYSEPGDDSDDTINTVADGTNGDTE